MRIRMAEVKESRAYIMGRSGEFINIIDAAAAKIYEGLGSTYML